MRYDKKIVFEIFDIVIPVMLSSIVSSVTGFLSCLFIAKTDVSLLSSCAVIYSVISVLTMLIYGFSIPVSIYTAKKLAANNLDEIRYLFHDATVIILCVSFIPCILLSESHHFMLWLRQPTSVASQCDLYFKAMFPGFVPMLMTLVIGQLLIGLNKARIYFLFTCMSALVNLLLVVILTPLFHMQGIGYASAATFWIVLILQIFCLMFHPTFKNLNLFHWSFRFSYIKPFLSMGFPIVVQRGSELLALSVTTFFMGWIGVAALSAQQIVSQITILLLMIPFGFMQAASVLIGKAYIQQDVKLIKKYIVHLNMLSTGVLVTLSLVFWIIPGKLVSLFLSHTNIDIKEIAVSLLEIAMLTLFFDNIRNVLTGVLRGLSDLKRPMLYSVLSLWLFAIPLSYIFAFHFHWGAIGIGLGWLCGIILGSALVIGRTVKFVR
jgi:multidrug resistance protein, MATE family